MTLSPGARLGPYEILTALGAGGMGEVYRARDRKLHRDVAIKVLPESFANNPERLVRFQREAQVLASLNHPNIGGIYGLEEAAGVRALVLELVEGPTLADRIAQGPLPLDEALPIARQIAEALEAAHEHGIIHRDLKPSNIKVRSDGAVKVLDFGLAKAMEPAGAMAASNSMSPTITTPAHLRQGYGGQAMTGDGVILGTAASMSPEQARGKMVDRRADIWAFGAVLYEMLTGKRAFSGDGVQDTLAAIMREGFRNWRLPITGLVERPLALSLDEIRSLPARTQITAHVCEQGWSAIGEWTGVPLRRVLEMAGGVTPAARYVVIHAFDRWYEAYDLFEVEHPQTILAYGLNGRDLPRGNGAPLRLRVERQCGYKNLKFLRSVQVVDSVAGFGRGTGGINSDIGFHWFAGV